MKTVIIAGLAVVGFLGLTISLWFLIALFLNKQNETFISRNNGDRISERSEES